MPKLPAVQRVLEHKFYFDELYDAIFYKPAAALVGDAASATSRSRSSSPSAPDLGDGALEVGRASQRIQTGLLRTYVLFFGAGMAVLAVVFLLVR